MTFSSHIIYIDDAIVAVDKPAGMPTHPGRGCRGVPSLLTAVRNHVGEWVYPVHRLDSGASGVVVFGRSSDLAATLSQAFTARLVTKTYRALVRGWLHGEGQIDRPLGRIDRDGEQEAQSLFRSLRTWSEPWSVRPFATSRYTIVEMQPITGRTHQLRRHLAGVAHPIIGDTKYGDGEHNKAFREYRDCHRLLLHACSLQLPHPITGELLTFNATAPALLT